MDENVRQLPRGRHGLSRSEVVASQRGRMADAVLEAVAANGYAATTVADVVRAAKVSRETFYEHHSSKDECYALALAEAAETVLAHALPALHGEADPVEGVDRFLAAYLTWMAEHPTTAHCLALELDCPGRPSPDDERGSIGALGAELARAFDATDPFPYEALVAALHALVAREVRTGRTTQLEGLREPLMAIVRRHTAAPARA